MTESALRIVAPEEHVGSLAITQGIASELGS